MNPRNIARALAAHGLLELAHDVALRHHVTMDELHGHSHHRPEALARRELWTLAYSIIPSLPRLGKLFGRDHTSILAAIQKHTARQRFARTCRPLAASLFPAEGPQTCNGVLANIVAVAPAPVSSSSASADAHRVAAS